jgi:hypothetical protein
LLISRISGEIGVPAQLAYSMPSRDFRTFDGSESVDFSHNVFFQAHTLPRATGNAAFGLNRLPIIGWRHCIFAIFPLAPTRFKRTWYPICRKTSPPADQKHDAIAKKLYLTKSCPLSYTFMKR